MVVRCGFKWFCSGAMLCVVIVRNDFLFIKRTLTIYEIFFNFVSRNFKHTTDFGVCWL